MMKRFILLALLSLPTPALADAAAYFGAILPITTTTITPSLPRKLPWWSCTRNFYVATTGSDGATFAAAQNQGTPWATITHAVAQNGLTGGDCINVAAGTYTEQPTLTKAGTADTTSGYLVLTCTTLRQCFIVEPAGGGANPGVVQSSTGLNYWVIDGFDITSSDSSTGQSDGYICINARSNSYMHVLNNTMHSCGAGGVSTTLNGPTIIERNITFNNAHLSTFHTSGISINSNKQFGFPALTNASGANNSGWWNVIRDNISYLNAEQEAGTHTDGNGIIVDALNGNLSGGSGIKFSALTLVENNLVFSNGGCGIAIGRSAFVWALGNTAFANNTDSTQAGVGTKGELCFTFDQNVTASYNVMVADAALRAGNVALQMTQFGTATMWNSRAINNLTFDGNASEASTSLDASVVSANNTLGVDPLFTDPANANFTFQTGTQVSGQGFVAPGTRKFALPF